MKYSIDRLDRIETILLQRYNNADRIKSDILFRERENTMDCFDLPEYKEADEITTKCLRALDKIKDVFNQSVDDFINEQIEIRK